MTSADHQSANDNDLGDALPGDLDDELLDLLEEYPSLRALPAVIRLVHARPWFENIGAPADGGDIDAARHYAEALGFPEMVPAFLETAEEAQEAALSVDLNDSAWEAEEQLRTALTVELVDLLGEDVVEMVFTHLAKETAPALQEAAQIAAVRAGIEDEDFVNVALGAGVQACHQAALVAMTGEPDHPFSLRFRLFERGRWPLAMVGTSFLIF